VLPRLRGIVPSIAVLVDTSGSMGAGAGTPLAAALAEVKSILRTVGSRVTVALCDTRVSALRTVTTIEQVTSMAAGHGGSDFRPAFVALAKLRPRPEIIVALTDGDICVPDTAPAGQSVIWVVVGGTRAPATWGESIIVREVTRQS
jgi:predicted metal-dependent peptidase